MSATLYLVRTTYQLTTLPFFLLWLPGLDWLFTRASPTGYDAQARKGRPTPRPAPSSPPLSSFCALQGACVRKEHGWLLPAYVNEVGWQLRRRNVRTGLPAAQIAFLEAQARAPAREHHVLLRKTYPSCKTG